MNKQKREHQQQIKAQKQAAADRKQTLIKYSLWAGAAILGLLLIFSFTQNLGLTIPDSSEIISTDQSKGFQKSPVVLVEYSDFQCPACAAQHRTIRAAWKDIRRKVHFVYRHYPLTNAHPNASLAAHYAEAAGQQGKFWEMHDQLFDNQSAWANLADPSTQFDEYARTLKLDITQLKTDLASQAVKDKIKADIASARAAGVDSTPTLFMNGERLSNVRDTARLVKVVDAAWDMR